MGIHLHEVFLVILKKPQLWVLLSEWFQDEVLGREA